MAETLTSRRRSPQEKKKLSYERDRVNVYGENDKSSRKAIRRFKAASHREERRAAAALVARMAGSDDDSRLEAVLSDVTAALPEKTKVSDVPLGVHLDKRTFKRRAGADHVPTRNSRESMKAAVRRASEFESRRLPIAPTESE